MSAQQDIDKIIDWYVANKPEVKQIHVNVTPGTVWRFTGKPALGMPLIYREREIVCLKKSAPKP
jgi:hypothetical protein